MEKKQYIVNARFVRKQMLREKNVTNAYITVEGN